MAKVSAISFAVPLARVGAEVVEAWAHQAVALAAPYATFMANASLVVAMYASATGRLPEGNGLRHELGVVVSERHLVLVQGPYLLLVGAMASTSTNIEASSGLAPYEVTNVGSLRSLAYDAAVEGGVRRRKLVVSHELQLIEEAGTSAT